MVGPNWALRYGEGNRAGGLSEDGGERVHVPRVDRGPCQALLVRGASRAARRVCTSECPPAGALALRLDRHRPPAHLSAGPAHRRPDASKRDLCRALRLRRQGRHLRRAVAVRDAAAVGGMGGGAVRFRLVAPSARRRIRHLPRQARYLRRTAGPTRDGLPRFQCVIALTAAALCLAGQERLLKSTTKRLVEELQRQILPDGGHVSRNPGTLIELLLDLLPLRQAFAARNAVPPPALINAVDRMMPMLRFFRHGDGNFALFNGMGPTAGDRLATVLAYDDARGNPVANAPHSGYQRLQADDAVVLVDTGSAPPIGLSHEAHAGCLSFELSSQHHRIVVNCGLPATNRESWRQLARATAAHSTVTFNDSSSCRFLASGSLQRLVGVPIVAGPGDVPVAREDRGDAMLLRASHDGYVHRYGVVHQRTIRLASNGVRLDGEDVFLPAHGESLPAAKPDAFAIRFHLHPAVKASRLSDGHGVMLMLPNRQVWTFTAYEDRVELEESVYLAASDGARRTVQIVIYGEARKLARVHWTFAQVERPEAGSRRDAEMEPELPL